MKRVKLSKEIDVSSSNEVIKIKVKRGRRPKVKEKTQNEMNPLGCPMDPMKIDLILSIIFDFCPVETLKTCRLVSRRWLDVSLRTWRNRAVLCPSKKAEGLKTIRQYIKLLQTKKDPFLLKHYPYRTFRIQTTLAEYMKDTAKPAISVARKMILSDRTYYPTEIEFLTALPQLESLELENCFWFWNEDQMIGSNLKRLKIYRNNFRTQCQGWEDILRCFPQLNALAIEYRGVSDNIEDIQRNVTCLESVRNSSGGSKMALKELEIIHVPQKTFHLSNCTCHEDIVDGLIQCRFPLEKLSLHLIWGEADLQKDVLPLHRLLDFHKEKLQYLSTSFNFQIGDVTNLLVSQLPEKRKMNPFKIRMEALRELHLGNGIWGLYILADLEMPNLERLTVDNGEGQLKMDDIQIQQFQLPLQSGSVCGKLDTFEFLDKRVIPGPGTIKAFAKMMPNLGRLTIPLDKYTFKIVCKKLKGLRMLHALAAKHRYVEFDDESITGIPKDVGGGREVLRRPNITSLEHLSEVRIESGTEWSEMDGLTDQSAIHGFLQLPKLYSLSVTFMEISDEVKAKLIQHVRGHVDIQVKPKFKPLYYCFVEVDQGERKIKWK